MRDKEHVSVLDMQEQVNGFIESIVYSQEETGFTVARLKEPRKQETTCIVGVMPGIQPGETIRCTGTWKLHPQHGMQFEVVSFDLQSPSDVLGIQKYLESGMIKGIGPAYAKRIVEAFGVETLEVIDKHPEKLSGVAGIGPKRIGTIQSCWLEQRSIRDVMIFLRGHGVSPAYAQKIFKAYGNESIHKVQSNPFALAKEIFGIGFKIADSIAKGLGIAADADVRIDSGIEYVLWNLSNEGHVCYPEEELVAAAAEILVVEKGRVEERIGMLLKQGSLVKERGLIWVKPLYLCEIGIAREVERLNSTSSVFRAVDLPKALQWVEARLKIELATEQKEAVGLGLSEKLLIITGGPGTGKSTITKAILEITERLSTALILAAPTGKAAKRMTEITGKKAQTIHSLLEMDFKKGGFKRNKDNPLECSLLIVDEASMIDTQLMYHLLKATPSSARLIFIGDIDQLPSVGPGTVLKDMIASQRIPAVQLKQIFRQASGSRIVTNAHRINQGEFPDLTGLAKSDFQFIGKESAEEILEQVVSLVKTRLPQAFRFHRFDDIQVLSPMKKGVIGTENLNAVLQKELNPSSSPLYRMGKTFHVGDKVMQIRNNYQKHVYNGDVGKIVEMDAADQFLKVAFDGVIISYEFSEIDELVLAYAVSIHKYQGSECPCIIIPIHTSHFKLLYRNLLYTGLTRGKKLVVFVGSPKAIGMAVSNEEVRRRHTGLKEQLECFLTTGIGR